MLLQYIRRYSPYPEAVFSILNQRTRHAVVKSETTWLATVS
jgi:hypothetical protein